MKSSKAIERYFELLKFSLLQTVACEEVKAQSFFLFLFHEEHSDKTLHKQKNPGHDGIFKVGVVDLTCECL